ncbi:hypothetical protein J6590_057474 [Homalodisca vitripennis]|nr:hypothetical protein J6590_057474 [Homalodisca vitripennis]
MNNDYQLFKLSSTWKSKGDSDFLGYEHFLSMVRPLKLGKRRVPDGVRLDGDGHYV